MSKVIIFATSSLGEVMAGPGIRSWEIAKVLSEEHEVTLVSEHQCTIKHDKIKFYLLKDPLAKKSIAEADVIVSSIYSFTLAKLAMESGTKLILDAYCPVMLEALEIFKAVPFSKRSLILKNAHYRETLGFRIADGFICASEKQCDLIIGMLLALNRIPYLNEVSPSATSFLKVVPFGLTSDPLPAKSGPGPREIFNLSPSDKILHWGGTICNWFDPCTLVRAMKLLSTRRPEVKLIFMGVKHPNWIEDHLKKALEAIELSKQLSIYNKNVFFNEQWFPYNERHNFLGEAFAGVSIHDDSLETRFSFRTRMLDYIWAELPIIATEGDSFAETIRQENIGIVTNFADAESIAAAVEKLLDNPDLVQKYRKNLSQLKSKYYWCNVVRPLNSMIKELTGDKKPASLPFKDTFINFCSNISYYYNGLKVKGVKGTYQYFKKRFDRYAKGSKS